MDTVDARGLSCPHPVMMALERIKSAGAFEILVDTEVSKENVVRAVSNKGRKVKEIRPTDTGYRITVEE